MKSIVLGVVALVGVSGFGATAAAEPRTHDGFQFRGALGGGYLSDSESAEVDDVSISGSVKGAAAALELYFGGTVAPGFVLGGYVSGASAPGPTAELDGESVETDDDFSMGLGTIGLYGDFYPQPRGGLHFLGTLGFARVTFNDDGDELQDATSEGIGLGLGVGYDFWVANEWSLGVLGRFTYAHTGHTESGIDVTDNVIHPALLFSVAYH